MFAIADVLDTSLEALPACPWKGNPYRLVTLWEMIIKLSGHQVAYAYGYLGNAEGISADKPVSCPVDKADGVKLSEALNEVEAACECLELGVTLSQVPRARKALDQASTYGDIYSTWKELRLRMHDELKQRLFLFIPPVEAKYYDVRQAFGPQVDNRFPSTGSDIEEAGDCIAVGRSTAAVFHLMRVMESLVQELGTHLGIQNTIDLRWQNILDQVNKAIKALPETNPTEKNHKEIIGALSAYLYNVKLAWRNPTMHPKVSYTPAEAVDIYDCVKRFAENLSTVV